MFSGFSMSYISLIKTTTKDFTGCLIKNIFKTVKKTYFKSNNVMVKNYILTFERSYTFFV